MSRGRLALILFAVALPLAARAQQQLPPPDDGKDTQITPDQLPPDEDKSKPQEPQYGFNPVQSNKELSVGEFYFKKNDFRAAASRFREATKWNESNADAWLRLGDAEEKMKDVKAAHEAWEKYLQLAPDAKNAAEVRKKLEKLKT
ncbi:MAG TPA: tetratricopeptide repeat protein [Bryobacteraceae bacterium]|nr:tetratricopeptide repeat protein [Bryobacteraceae bacterium]